MLFRHGGDSGRQRSLAVTRHAAMMDPVALAMAACLCVRLRTISKGLKLKMTKTNTTKCCRRRSES